MYLNKLFPSQNKQKVLNVHKEDYLTLKANQCAQLLLIEAILGTQTFEYFCPPS